MDEQGREGKRRRGKGECHEQKGEKDASKESKRERDRQRASSKCQCIYQREAVQWKRRLSQNGSQS